MQLKHSIKLQIKTR